MEILKKKIKLTLDKLIFYAKVHKCIIYHKLLACESRGLDDNQKDREKI